MNHITKKCALLLLAGFMTLSLAACGGAPSEEKIRQALDDGTITVEDAKAKGWIDEAWIKENIAQVAAATKIHLLDPFETTYLDGSAASSSLISGQMCLVFFNTEKNGALEKLDVFNQNFETMKEKGVPVLGVIMDENPAAAQEKLKEIQFPVIVFNGEMKDSMEKYSEILDGDLTYVFTKDGGFYTAWYTNAEKETILEAVDWLAQEE